MKTAFLALGSNLGDRLGYLADALRGLQATGDVWIEQVSSVYETLPVGVAEQPDFLNLVAKIRTRLTPDKLLEQALAVETSLGRVRRERWGPRTIDIDLLWFEGETVTSPVLTLPHPRITERGFVLVPLAEIAPQLLLDGQTAGERARHLGEAGLKKRGPLGWTRSPGIAR